MKGEVMGDLCGSGDADADCGSAADGVWIVISGEK